MFGTGAKCLVEKMITGKNNFLEQLIIKRYFCGNKGNRIIGIILV